MVFTTPGDLLGQLLDHCLPSSFTKILVGLRKQIIQKPQFSFGEDALHELTNGTDDHQHDGEGNRGGGMALNDPKEDQIAQLNEGE